MGERGKLFNIEDLYLKEYGKRVQEINAVLADIQDDINYLSLRLREHITPSERIKILRELRVLKLERQKLKNEKEELESTLRGLSQGPEA